MISVIKHNGIYPKNEFKKTSSLAQYPDVKIHLQFCQGITKAWFLNVCLPEASWTTHYELPGLLIEIRKKWEEHFLWEKLPMQQLQFPGVTLLHLMCFTFTSLVLHFCISCVKLQLPLCYTASSWCILTTPGVTSLGGCQICN